MHTDVIQYRYLTYLCESQNYICLEHKLEYQKIHSRNVRDTDRGIEYQQQGIQMSRP